MTAYLFLDTETTGFGQRDRICAFAWQLDIDGVPALQDSSLIKTYNWHPHPDALTVHGITCEIATEYGVSLANSIIPFIKAIQGFQPLVIAHQISFDVRMINQHLLDFSMSVEWPSLFCTMKALTKIMGKKPTLDEAFRWATGNDFNLSRKHHLARLDMLACRAVFYRGKELELW